MPHPLPGSEKIKEKCSSCGETVWIPPGVYYRGEPYHKGCAKFATQVDFGDEVLEPMFENVEDGLMEVLDQ